MILPPKPRIGSPAAKKIAEANKKVQKLSRQTVRAKVKRNALRQVDNALKEAGPNILDEGALKDATPLIKAQVKENVIFEPNPGPQTAFLAASEKEVFYGGARGGGKLLDSSLFICTTAGYKKFGELEVGDRVFTDKGTPTEVVWVSETEHNPDAYELTFDSGEIIKADAKHLWKTLIKTDRIALYSNNEVTSSVKTTKELFDTPTVQKGREVNHSILTSAPLQFDTLALPIDPYTLGLWLGDGYSHTSRIGMAEEDMDEILQYIPYEIKAFRVETKNRKTPFKHVKFDFFSDLKQLNLLKNKHIPEIYLQSSIEQRKELLQGLLDTDGHCCKTGQIEVSFSNKRLIEDCLKLVCSLGIKAAITSKTPKIKDKVYQRHFRMKFLASFEGFKLKRKVERQKLTGFRGTTKQRYIVDIKKTSSVPMRCIQIADPSGMFLIGETLIATHNSYALIIDPLRDCIHESHRALIIRRTMPELRDLIEHSKRLYPKAFPGVKWREQEKEWRFPSGARIEFGYAETRQDALRYQGQAYTWIGVDELPQYPDPGILDDLRGSLRSVDINVPTYMRFSGNPGNIGSHWVREMFIEPAPWGEAFTVSIPTPHGEKKITRRFIPAKLQDNPYLTQSDDYLIMLASLPEIKRKQWLEGDWDAFDNAAFPEFNRKTHVIEPFEVPRNWPRFRACDWGYSSPACVLWFAVDYDDVLYIYRELYVKGLDAAQFSQKTLNLETRERVNYGILDSSVWAKRGDTGPGIAEVMMKAGLRWRPSDRSPGSRISGKMELHRRLAVDTGIGEPKLKIFSTCANLIRTLPQLPLDEHNVEDVDTKAEDHAYDALRYGCMSRPVTPGQYSASFISEIRDRFVAADTDFGY